MYYKNLMISYSGKKAYCPIHELKYDSSFISKEKLREDLLNNFSNIKRLVVELDPGEFDDYANHLSWDGKFYGIPAEVCQEVIDKWDKAQKLTSEEESDVDEWYKNPLTSEFLKTYEYKITRNHLIEMILFHDKIRVEEYHLTPIGIEYYEDIINNFHYKE